jgi:hypothetical protein
MPPSGWDPELEAPVLHGSYGTLQQTMRHNSTRLSECTIRTQQKRMAMIANCYASVTRISCAWLDHSPQTSGPLATNSMLPYVRRRNDTLARPYALNLRTTLIRHRNTLRQVSGHKSSLQPRTRGGDAPLTDMACDADGTD